MRLAVRERLVYLVATIMVVLAAFWAVVLDGDLELTMVMVAAVVAGLVCFDTSMERQLHSFGPWLVLSLAPAAKTVPMVWQELRAESGASFERYDHAGSLLFGLCVFVAAALLAKPAPALGAGTAVFDRVAVLGSAFTVALAGASVAFLFDSDFGTVTAGRALETPTWFFIGGILAAVVVAASRTRELSWSLTGVLSAAAGSAGLLAFSVAGGSFDRGLWAVVFAAIAVSAAVPSGDLGQPDQRDRLTNVPVVIVIIAGAIAAAAAISARSDRTSWGPGWAILGVMSLALFALAMASRPLEEQRLRRAEDRGPLNIGLDDAARAARAKERALAGLNKEAPLPTAVLEQTVDAGPATETMVVVAPEGAETTDAAHGARQPQASPQPTAQSSAHPVPMSDGSIVAAARAAAAVRTAPSTARHSLAPIEQAHHFDPSTGLLSAAGLQHAIARAFDVPRQAGHVTIMMFMIRDLDRIERAHGRLASAAVTRAVAERVTSLLPDGTGARFARSAYAIVFIGDMSDSDQTIQRLARVLLQLRAPVEGGSLGDKIDAVAGMAQCYEREDAAQFVKRANMGLARAVQSPEPIFVAMP